MITDEFADGGDWDASGHVRLLRQQQGASSGYTADLIERLYRELLSRREAEEAEVPCPECGRNVMAKPEPATGFLASCGRRLTTNNELLPGGCDAARARRAASKDAEPVAWQYRYWYSSGEPGVWLNERRKDADDLLESGVLIREETRALYLGDSEAGAESSLRNVQTTTSGLSPFAGWQNYQHQRAACAAVFRDGWSMEDENTLIDLVTRTWPCPSPAKTSTGE